MKQWENDIFEALFTDIGVNGTCEMCKEPNETLIECGPRAFTEPVATMLCTFCAREYHEYWDEMWSMHYSDKL